MGTDSRFPINVLWKINELWSENGVSPPFFHGFMTVAAWKRGRDGKPALLPAVRNSTGRFCTEILRSGFARLGELKFPCKLKFAPREREPIGLAAICK